MPITKLGKWAGGLIAAFVGFLFALIMGLKIAGLKTGTPVTIALGTCMTLSGIAAFVAGLVALIRFKDRTFVVFLAVVLGFLASLISIMEMVEGLVSFLTH